MNEIGILFGESGTGKSFVTLDMLASLAIGRPEWAAGNFIIKKARRVLYCAGEGESGIQKRLYAVNELYQDKYGLCIPGDMFTYLPLLPQLFDNYFPQNANAFCDEVVKVSGNKPFDLIAIDTLSQATIGAKENDNSDMAKVLYRTRELQRRLGSTLIYIHHAGKDGRYRGASALLGNVDFMLEVCIVRPDCGMLRCVKIKDGKPFADIGYELRHVESRFDEAGTNVVEWLTAMATKPVWQRLADYIDEHPERGHTAKSLADETGIPLQQVKNAICYHIDHMIARFHRELQRPDRKPSSSNAMTYWSKVNTPVTPSVIHQ